MVQGNDNRGTTGALRDTGKRQIPFLFLSQKMRCGKERDGIDKKKGIDGPKYILIRLFLSFQFTSLVAASLLWSASAVNELIKATGASFVWSLIARSVISTSGAFYGHAS